MIFTWLLLNVLLSNSEATGIELLECDPPDKPVWGSYGPKEEYYLPGDIIHYYCDVETYIGGNYKRKCLDTGDWSDNTPVCDPPATFTTTSQSSDIDEDSGPEKAVDLVQSTCSETIGGEIEEWSGTFKEPGQLIRVKLFLPKGPVSFQVVLVKQNGEEVICGSHTRNINRLDWIIQNCPEPNNVGASGLKIKSLTNDPLIICEIQAFVLSSPRCVDPRLHIENGHVQLTRKTATLVCDKGYTRSKDAILECVRDGEWNRKNLYCIERQWEIDDRESLDDDKESRGPDTQPNRNPGRERLRSV